MRYSKSINNIFKIGFLFVISCFLFSCHEEKIDRVPLKIIFTRLPKSLITDDNMLSNETTSLLEGVINDSKRCQDTIILDPIFVRADIANSDTSMAYPSKKSSLARISVKREFKLLKEYLQSVSIPSALIEREGTKSDSLYKAYILSNVDLKTDSLLVYSSSRKVDSLDISNRKYKAFSDVESVRKQIQSVLCSNPKATITLLIDPPTQIAKPNPPAHVIVTSPGSSSNPGNVKPQKSGKIAEVRSYGGNHTRPVGDLTILKGSEGCDICTRYYSAYDATGHVHEIKEKNSTNCCPCNKTVEIRGQTFVMNCDGSPRLQPAN